MWLHNLTVMVHRLGGDLGVRGGRAVCLLVSLLFMGIKAQHVGVTAAFIYTQKEIKQLTSKLQVVCYGQWTQSCCLHGSEEVLSLACRSMTVTEQTNVHGS